MSAGAEEAHCADAAARAQENEGLRARLAEVLAAQDAAGGDAPVRVAARMEMARPLSGRVRAGEAPVLDGADPGSADPGGAAAAALVAAAGRVADLEEGARRAQAELGRLQALLEDAQARAPVAQP